MQNILVHNGKSIAEIISNEGIRPLVGWNIYNHKILTKEFSNPITYALPIVDLAQNTSEVPITIQNATNIVLQYGTYDAYSKQTLVSSGKISAPKTISSNSIGKVESIFMKLSGSLEPSLLQGRCYLYTYWGDSSIGTCNYSKHSYCHGYSQWIDSTVKKSLTYFKNEFTQLGGIGLNVANAISSNKKQAISSAIARQYLYGISGIQFKLKNSSDYAIVYQSYVKGIGWLTASCDGQENVFQHNKPISAFRMNIVPKTEKQYLINFWNRDVGTNHLD